MEVSLFTREWIEIPPVKSSTFVCKSSPSLRGSGLKCQNWRWTKFCLWSPSLRGSGLKSRRNHLCINAVWVSLFTREWIEICTLSLIAVQISGLPLYEGVDWNTLYCIIFSFPRPSPSLRGSGLKSEPPTVPDPIRSSPSLRGSGLKSIVTAPIHTTAPVSLFTREWIEMSSNLFPCNSHKSLPLYEGVDWNMIILYAILGVMSVSLFTREWIEILP